MNQQKVSPFDGFAHTVVCWSRDMLEIVSVILIIGLFLAIDVAVVMLAVWATRNAIT